MMKKKKCTLCTRASSRDYYNDNATAASVSGTWYIRTWNIIIRSCTCPAVSNRTRVVMTAAVTRFVSLRLASRYLSPNIIISRYTIKPVHLASWPHLFGRYVDVLCIILWFITDKSAINGKSAATDQSTAVCFQKILLNIAVSDSSFPPGAMRKYIIQLSLVLSQYKYHYT